MIISKKNKFIFIKTPKTAGSSLEFYLSQFCGKEDIITPLQPDEENLKKKSNILTKRNYIVKTFSLRNFKKFQFTKKIILHDHVSLNYIEKNIKLNLKDYYIFAFVRNPFEWIVSLFWWHLYFYKTFDLKKINSLNKKEINLLFRLFITTRCAAVFHEIKQIIFSKKHKVNIFKYEDLNKNILYLKKKLKLDREKIKINEINLKRLDIKSNIKKKIKFSKKSVQAIKREAKFIYERYNYSKIVPKKYI